MIHIVFIKGRRSVSLDVFTENIRVQPNVGLSIRFKGFYFTSWWFPLEYIRCPGKMFCQYSQNEGDLRLKGLWE